MITTEHIVGTATHKSWAQIYDFSPEGDKKSRGKLTLVIRLSFGEKGDEEFDLAAFGKEAITRFNETYYGSAKQSSSSKGVLGNLRESFSVLTREFGKDLEIEGLAAVVLKEKEAEVLYLAKVGGGSIKIWRDGKLFSLLSYFSPTVQTVSGFLKEGDLVILGTKAFFEVIPEGTLRAFCQQSKLSEAVEMIVPLVHGREDSSQIAAVWLKAEKEKRGLEFDQEEEEETKFQKRKLLKEFFVNFKDKIRRFTFKKRGEGLGLTLRQEKSFKPVKKTAVSVAIIFLLLLALSVFLGSRKKTESKRYEGESKVLERVAYSLEQSRGLTDLNPLRAKSLLKEAETLLKDYRAEKGEVSEEFKNYESKVLEALSGVSKEYQVESPAVFFDFSLTKQGFSGESFAFSGKELAVLGKARDAVLNLTLEDKSAQIVVGGDDIKDMTQVGAVSPWVFLAKDDRILVIDKAKRKKIDEKKLSDMKIVSLVGFGGNAYILDKKAGQIWRMVSLDSGLSDPKKYLKAEKLDFSEAVSMAIDGSVWVLFSNGEIVKYTRGEKDAFSIAGLDKPFNEPIKLFTDENQDNLYVLDRKDTRVVVIGKAGEYRGSYIWQGIAGATDFVVSESLGKILLLTGDRVYEIELKK